MLLQIIKYLPFSQPTVFSFRQKDQMLVPPHFHGHHIQISLQL